MDFFENLDPLLKVYWYIAIPVSLIFIVQTVLTFIGIDADVDTDFEVGHDGEGPFQLFSFRNLINFLIGLSWTGIAFYSTINNHLILIAISVVIGIAFVLFFFFIIQQIQRLAEDNSFKIQNALSKTGQVYLTVPARKEGKGKVQISVNGTVHELSAITEHDKLETGVMVRVTAIVDEHILVVEKNLIYTYMLSPLILIVVAVIVIFITFSALISRFKRCPSDKILVIYGKTGGTSAKCVHGGGAFIWPVIQDYAFLDLKPISIEANLTNALSRQNIRVDVPCRFTIAISTEADSMNNAAERLLGMAPDQIQELSKDILFGQLRLVIATMTIEEINSDRDKFLDNISKNVDAELKKIGLKLINVNVTDIKDESGYIEALGKEAAAKAINEAKISVAEQEKIGETGKAAADRERDVSIAETHRDRDVKIAITNKDREISIASAAKDESIGKAEAQRDTRVKTSEANAIAVKGENEARISIANSEALRREKEAESLRIAITAEKVQQAKALEESYVAEQKAELARSERERSTQIANVVIPAEIAKQRAIIDAQAEAERIRENAKGEADAIYAKMEAEAKGLYEILTKQAQGYEQVVKAAGGDPTKAFQLLLIEKLPELVKTQVEAVKNIKIDKITVWDSGTGNDGGNGSTANFVSGMMKTVPPLNDLFNMAGLNLPTYLKGADQLPEAPAMEATPDKKK